MLEDISKAIRDVPDFPKPGIVFKDITPVLSDPVLFKEVIDLLSSQLKDLNLDKVAVIESRGFLFGTPIARELGIGIVPIRKKGKLPYRTIEESYELEYGTATLEVHEDALQHGDRVIIVDDLLATGGTAVAAAKLIEKLGGQIVQFIFLVELSFLEGRKRLEKYDVYAPIVY